MDREEAKFILASFRPGGQDTNEEMFRDALALTIEDQELGQWFVRERAFDSEMSDSLCGFEVPKDLKDKVCELMNAHLDSHSSDELLMIGALATIQPPANLKQDILHAMNASVSVSDASEEVKSTVPKKNNIIKMFFPVAIAAAVAIAAFLGGIVIGPGTSDVEQVAMSEFASKLNSMLVNGEFTLDHEESNYLKTVSWVEDSEMPYPTSLPVGLEGVPTMGCKKLNVDGVPAVIICFDMEGLGPLHLISIDDSEGKVKRRDNLPTLSEADKRCYNCPLMGGASKVDWQEGDKVFMLIAPESDDAQDFDRIF